MAERNAWHKSFFRSFDLETTGIDVHNDRIVTASIVDIDPSKGTVKSHEWLVDPQVEIPEQATKVHGVTTAQARAEGAHPRDALREIDQHIRKSNAEGQPIVAFNGAYDMSLIHAEYERHGLDTTPLLEARVIDAHVLDKKLRQARGPRKLDATAEAYGVKLDNAHNSSADSIAAARIAWHLAERYPDDVQIDLDELHDKQRTWRADQSASLQSFLRSKADGDPEAMVAPQWPIRFRGDDEDASKSPYRTSPEQQREEAAARRAASDAARSAADRVSEGIQEGHYAVQNEDGSMELFRVDKPDSGRWKGYTFVKREVDGDYEDVRDPAEKTKVLGAIQKDPHAATVAYGHSTGVCGRCHRRLTDEASVAAGIGPVCATK